MRERHERIDRAEIGRPDSSKNALTPGEQAELAAFRARVGAEGGDVAAADARAAHASLQLWPSAPSCAHTSSPR